LKITSTDRPEVIGASFAYEQEQLRTLFKNLPSRAWDPKSKRWLFPLFDLSRVVTVARQVAQEPAEVEPEVLEAYKAAQESYRRLVTVQEARDCEEFATVPGLKTALMPFQRGAVKLALLSKKFLLAYDVGLGKTVISIGLTLALKQVLGRTCKTLVVCKGSHKHRPWAELIRKFCDEKYLVIEGPLKRREKAYAAAASPDVAFIIINYEMIVQDAEFIKVLRGEDTISRLESLGPLEQMRFDLVVLDEVVKVKNPSAKTSKCMKRLANAVPYAIGLTGTPVKNSIIDLYGIFGVLQPLLFSNYFSFIGTYCIRNYWGAIKRYKNLEALTARIQPFSHQLRKSDVLKDLPAVIINNYGAELMPAQRKALEWLCRIIEEGPGPDERAIDPLAANVYMREICNSALLVADKVAVQGEHSGKMVLLEDLLEELLAEDRKVVIFSYFAKMVALLAKGLKHKCLTITGDRSSGCPEATVDNCGNCRRFKRCSSRKREVWRFWNDEKARVIIGTDAMGEGYDLQCSDVVINFDLPWTSAEFKQRVGRIYRIGQTARTVNVINLVCLGTIEEEIVDKINMKEKLSNDIIQDYSFTKLSIDQLKRGSQVQRDLAMEGTYKEEPCE